LLDSFEVEFELSRPAQKLALFPSLGLVEIELELEGREPISMRVPPIQASIIHLFESQDTLTLSEIAIKLQMMESSLEPKIQFWVREGVLREIDRAKYQLIEGSDQSQS
ncbi:Anaphase-promoting complex subunit 2, partial [Haplosporangium bisporale]